LRRLYLLRHAKSSWDDAALADHDRPLAPRGREATKLIAEHLRGEGVAPPAIVLCSSALRARETLEGISPWLDGDAAVEVEEGLYGASERELLARLQRLPDDLESAMLVGHNPGVHGLALSLIGGGAESTGIENKYPTGALTTLEFEGGWRELEPGAARLIAFVRPRDL
jgi:phosphohistidine phosphatase